MIRIIECQVNDEYILGSGVPIGAAGSFGDVILRLSFNETWDGLNIVATFKDALGQSEQVVMLLPGMLTEGEVRKYDVPIPRAAKITAGRAKLTLSGYSTYSIEADGTKIVKKDSLTNTATAFFRVLESDSAMVDDESVDASLAEQLFEEIEEIYSRQEEWARAEEGYWNEEGVFVNGRVQNEEERVAAESERIKAEQARVQNEEGRVGAEINRQVAELGAIGNYYDAEENAVKDAEGNVVDNTNAGRVGAEIERKKVTGDIGQALEKILETQNAYLHDEVSGTLEEKLNYITTQLTKLDGAVDELKAELGAGGTDGENTFLRAHPVGSIYICVGSKDDTEEIIATKSPQSLFGGTWERIKDRFLLAAGDNYAAGTEGGEDAVTLTAEQLPLHQHYLGTNLGSSKVYARNNLTKADAASGAPYIARLDSEAGYYEEPENQLGKLIVNDVGQTRDSAHNNMPPYFAVYMWKRVG